MDIEVTVQKLQDFGLIRANKIVGDWYSIYCPIHNDGGEHKPSAGILLHDIYKNGKRMPKGMCHCFACGWSKSLPDTITEIFKQRGISNTGLEWLKQNVPGFEVEMESDLIIPIDTAEALEAKQKENIYKLNKLLHPEIVNYIPETELATYRYVVPYMYERKMTNYVISKYDIGFDAHYHLPGKEKEIPCITFPVRDINGNTLFLVRRSIQGKDYYMPKDITKPLYGIYELPKNTNYVILVESCINAITLASWGYPAIALLGTGTPIQINRLLTLGIKQIILALDPDGAGDKGSARLYKALHKSCLVWKIDMPREETDAQGIVIQKAKDVNDCTKAEFDELFANRY